MTKQISILMAAVFAFGFAMTVIAPDAEAGRRSRRNLAIGLGAAAATAIIIGSSRRARADDGYYYDERPRMSCRRLYIRCEDGSDWACRKYDRYC